jgi:hypothetical protein
MSLTRIIVLANSWKHHDWCLAGIHPDTGEWIRPVTGLPDGRVREQDMKTGGHFPQLLDVIDIPLAPDGPDFDFESENRSILPGRWYVRGQATAEDVAEFARPSRYVLHNHMKYVAPSELQRKPPEKRTTLQLLLVDDFKVRDKRRSAAHDHNWVGAITSGGRDIEVKITDPVYFERLDRGHKAAKSCVLTISLGLPYKPPNWGKDEEPVCWKLIAGVVELD